MSESIIVKATLTSRKYSEFLSWEIFDPVLENILLPSAFRHILPSTPFYLKWHHSRQFTKLLFQKPLHGLCQLYFKTILFMTPHQIYFHDFIVFSGTLSGFQILRNIYPLSFLKYSRVNISIHTYPIQDCVYPNHNKPLIMLNPTFGSQLKGNNFKHCLPQF